MTLRVWTNHTDTVIAADLDAVRAILRAHYGSNEFDDEAEEFQEVPSTELIRIRNFHGRGHDDVVERTAAEFAASEGAGFLCSTEW